LRKVPWLLAVPCVVAVLAFRYTPSVLGAIYAFTNWTGGGLSAHWTGFGNFTAIFNNPETSSALWRTLLLAGLFVVFSNALGLAMALACHRAVTRNLLRALIFLPFALSDLAVSYVWQYIFQYNGPINSFLATVGLGSWRATWLADPRFALFTILIVLVWQYTGLTMVLYLAGLAGIPDELTDAAAVDGASSWMRFRRVTFPLLAPALTVSVGITLIFGLSAFSQVIALTGGGPINDTETLATEMYKYTFTYGEFGYGAAIAVVLTIIVAVMATLQIGVFRARETRL
jgi:raffinose/stachyose/melibiose transport system permease protein